MKKKKEVHAKFRLFYTAKKARRSRSSTSPKKSKKMHILWTHQAKPITLQLNFDNAKLRAAIFSHATRTFFRFLPG